LESLQPVNQRIIDAENQRIEAIQQDHAKVLERAKQLYRYEPLVADLFPGAAAEKRIEFRTKYAEAMRKLLESLHWGGPPTSADIEAMKDKIDNEKAAQRQFGGEPTATPSAAAASGTHTPAEVLTKLGAKNDQAARASIAAAQKIYCYAVNFFEDKPPDRVASLEFWPTMKDTGTVEAPETDDVWRAQVSYWIQKDVVEAIVAVNDEAGEAAKQAKEDQWVGIMPVKEIISIRVSDYVPPTGELFSVSPPVGYIAALPPGSAESVFTGTASGDSYEVVQFTVKLIMDQRDIPLLVERLCNNSFLTLLRVSYKSVPVNKAMTGKVYGAEPTVLVVMDFESVMLGEVFRPLMPTEVCDKYDWIKCPERKADNEE
ncbi:MAG: hypothetical protein AAB385_01335, partial [Planctomycetota bacterium]